MTHFSISLSNSIKERYSGIIQMLKAFGKNGVLRPP